MQTEESTDSNTQPDEGNKQQAVATEESTDSNTQPDEDGEQPAVATDKTKEASADKTPTKTATYEIEYKVVWSSDTHPKTLPKGAHVSPIVLATHKEEGALFKSNSPASDGIEIMAETGATATLIDELTKNPSTFKTAVGQVINAPRVC